MKKYTQEKLKSAYSHFWSESCHLEENEIDSNLIARDCIEKQIAKKPIHEQVPMGEGGGIIDGEWFYHCPNCSAIVNNDNPNYEFCPKCGQRLDWGE